MSSIKNIESIFIKVYNKYKNTFYTNNYKTFNNFFHDCFITKLGYEYDIIIETKDEQIKLYNHLISMFHICNHVDVFFNFFTKEILQHIFVTGKTKIEKLDELYKYIKDRDNLKQNEVHNVITMLIDIFKLLDGKKKKIVISEYNKYITKYKNYCTDCNSFYNNSYVKCPINTVHLIHNSEQKYETCTECGMDTDIFLNTKKCRWCHSEYTKQTDSYDLDSNIDEEKMRELELKEKNRFILLKSKIDKLYTRLTNPFVLTVNLLNKNSQVKYLEKKVNHKTLLNKNIKIDELKSIVLYKDCVNRIQDEIILQKCALFHENDMYDILKDICSKKSNELKGLKQKEETYPLFMKKIDIPSSCELIVIGDIHCDLQSFITILLNLKNKNIIDNNFNIVNGSIKKYKFIFLGDMVDYGFYGLEILFLIFMLKKNNYDDVFIINGNHEDVGLHGCTSSRCGDFGYEKKIKLKNKNTYSLINRVLNTLPCVLFIRFDKDKEQKYFQFCHGGIDGYVTNLFDFLHNSSKNKNIMNVSYPNLEFIYPGTAEYLYSGFKWTDFNNNIKEYSESSRGKGLLMVGYKYTERYLQRMKIHSIISGHQDTTAFSVLLNNEQKRSEHFILDDYVQMQNNVQHLYELYNLNNNITYELIPGVDFLTCVTSTAISAKNIKRNIHNIQFNEQKNEEINYYLSEDTIPKPIYLHLRYNKII